MTLQKNYQPDDFHCLSNQILLYTSCCERRIEFVKEVTKLLHSFTGCDIVELWIMKDGNPNLIEKAKISRGSFTFNESRIGSQEKDQITNRKHGDSDLSNLSRGILLGHYNPTLPLFTKKGSFFTCNTDKPCRISFILEDKTHDVNLDISGEYKSIAIIPLVIDNKKVGILHLMSSQNNFFTKDEIELFERTILTLSSALLNQLNQEALSERVKELTCLYRIAKIAEQTNGTLDGIFHEIIKLLPPAWQYPEVTCGRIIFDGRSYSTKKYKVFSDKMAADIIVTGRKRGLVEVIYLEKMNEFDEGPFLQEERSLLNTIAENIALIVERKEASEERLKLQIQLRHADRLATIGQLAAGVAHELNEPLGNILGLAQLANKYPDLPKQIEQDLNKIIAVSLDAREIIRQLMVFARQKIPEKTTVNLNQIVNEGLVFFESRCRKEGIELVRLLSSDLPEIIADRSQIHQVLVNLITNAIQAMPKGGVLTIQTEVGENHVSLIVEDTGTGISDEAKKQMFIPFFTTKEIGQGTGIGLSVVHGVIMSHNGMIKVESKLGIGARFEVQLPLNDESDK
nr:GHKL domain-containing protein [Bacteroidota bacterium]